MQQILCLTAGQRSGTTALRSLISETGKFADLGEIFDTAIIDEPQSFFGFCRKNDVGFADILSGPDAEDLCKRYMAHLRALARDRHLLIDVKFNSWGEIRMPWTFMHQEPFFLRQLKWVRAKIIFIWRRDLVAQIVSDRLSDAIGKWHNLEPADVKTPVHLDEARLAERAKLMCLSERYFFENLRTYGHALMYSYEHLFGSGKLATDAAGAIARLLGEPLSIPESGLYAKSRIDKSAAVENVDAIARAIEKISILYREPLLAENNELPPALAPD